MNEDKSRQRLGRGLASLIGSGGTAAAKPLPYGSAANQQAASATIPAERHVSIDLISPNPRNPRRRFDETDLADLAASLRQHGIVQPLLVRPDPDRKDAFEIVAGERRWRAARLAGLLEVPVVLRDIGDRQSLEIAIIENVQRADLDAIEEALAYQKLVDEHGYTQADLADVLGKSRSHVANTLRLLKLPEAVRDMVSSGRLSPGAARTVVKADDPEATARDILERGLTVREAEELARQPQAGGAAASSTARGRDPRHGEVSREGAAVDGDRRGEAGTGSAEAPPASGSLDRAPATKHPETRELERLLSNALGLPVDIEVAGNRGSVRINYADMAQLDELCRRLHAVADVGRGPRVRSL